MEMSLQRQVDNKLERTFLFNARQVLQQWSVELCTAHTGDGKRRNASSTRLARELWPSMPSRARALSQGWSTRWASPAWSPGSQ